MSTDAEHPAGDPPGSARGARAASSVKVVFLGLVLGMLLHALTMTIVSTALPAIVTELGGLSQLPWVVSSYLLAATVTVPLVGKASDAIGRRPLFQLAILVFVIGSVLCGLAQSMGQLIAARCLQGIAGGSLMAMSQAMIGDVVPPRQRGRYQGYIGAVFALASLAGPLVGGFLVDFFSWRAIFYLNVPVGLTALFITQRYLHLHHVRRKFAVDALGALVVMAGTASVLLVSAWGGQQFAWDSPVILALIGVAFVSALLFVPVERRAKEPIVPLRLFRDRVFVSGTVLSFFFGMGLMGTVVFMPTFFQAVSGTTATTSGLALVPLMATNLLASIVSGRLITRWGRYRVFPVVGTAILVVGFAMLATMSMETSVVTAALMLSLVGVGIGFVVQVVVLAVQNTVDIRDLGVATSATQFSRMMGSTLGLAGFGAVVNVRFGSWVAQRLEATGLPADFDAGRLVSDPAAMAKVPAAVQKLVRAGLADAITGAFRYAVPVLVFAFAFALMLRDRPMHDEAEPTVEPDAEDPSANQ